MDTSRNHMDTVARKSDSRLHSLTITQPASAGLSGGCGGKQLRRSGFYLVTVRILREPPAGRRRRADDIVRDLPDICAFFRVGVLSVSFFYVGC